MGACGGSSDASGKRRPYLPRAIDNLYQRSCCHIVAGAAAGSYLGDVFGGPNVFLIAAALGAVALTVKVITLPSLAPERPTPIKTLYRVLARPGIGAGIVAIILVFSGHLVLFTYVRPFLEIVSGAGIERISTTLLAFGVANLIGTLAHGMLLTRNLRMSLLSMPGIIALVAILLIMFVGETPALDTILISVWGMVVGAVPVGWSTWITRAVPDEAESAGGHLGAAVQLAIAFGAAAGGFRQAYSSSIRRSRLRTSRCAIADRKACKNYSVII